ncbi:MAG: GAF domain-containing sensor histidine kinase [Actinomycetota bacterium]|nr:GAF domain-containing sensor histidine kinase [Actinomycetota bacterium]
MVYEKASTRTLSTRAASRLAWSVWMLSVALAALGALLLIANRSVADPVSSPYATNAVVAALGFSTVGALVASCRPENPIGWLLTVAGLLFGLTAFASEYSAYVLFTDRISLPGGVVMAWLFSWLWVPSGSLIMFAILLFPHGRPSSTLWRVAIWLAAYDVCLSAASLAFMPGPLWGLPSNFPPVENPFGIEGTAALLSTTGSVSTFLLGVFALSAAVALFVRLFRSSGEERQQLKWVAYAVAVLTVGIIISSISEAAGESLLSRIPVLVGFLTVPVAIGIAVLKYRLYDIDLLINRTLVYGVLTVCVVGLYVLVVGYLGAMFRTGGNLWISLVATGVVAVLFAPLRDRLQRGVNRLMYGERDEPYAVISRLGERLEATLASEAALSTIVETVAGALKLPYSAITLKQNGEFVRAAEYGTPPQEPVVLPLAYQSDTVGQLILAPRSPGESFSPSDKRLLEDLSRQAGVTAHAVRLTADLQRSREQLVSAREEERRRLRRDLHDGLGPRLAAQTLKAGSARSLYPRDPAAADALLSELEADTEAALSEVRRLVHDLRPPALDELGLVGAIREATARYATDAFGISVEAPAELPPLPAAVEVAAYRIAQEAVTNVVRHAKATSCLVRFSSEDGVLELEVSDDGIGLPEGRRAGVGLHSMRERAEELGGECKIEPAPSGGTRVVARLPLSGERAEGG